MITLLLLLSLQSEVLHYTAPEPVYFEARITNYTWTGNRMANGEWPHEGACATSDRTIPFGTIVEFAEGGYCVVKDRTNIRIHEEFPHLTIDLFTNATEEEALDWGRHYKQIALIR